MEGTAISHIFLCRFFFSSTVSFPKHKFLIFRKSNLATVFFADHAFGAIPKKCLPNPRSRTFPPMVSSKRIAILPFMSRYFNSWREQTYITALKSLAQNSIIWAILGLAFIDCLLPQELVTFCWYTVKF